MKKFTKKQIKSLPPYIRLGENGGTTMRLKGRGQYVEYYRDAGVWSIDFRIDKETGKLFAVANYPQVKHLRGDELVPISREEWAVRQQGYIGPTTKPYIFGEYEEHETWPECGAKIIEQYSGIKCSKCNYWFCY